MKSEEDADVNIRLEEEENEPNNELEKHARNSERMQKLRAIGSKERSPRSQRTTANQFNAAESVSLPCDGRTTTIRRCSTDNR